MVPAPTLERFEASVKDNRQAVHVLVFAPRFSRIANEVILPRVEYLHLQSDQSLHFYMAGYGAYPAEERKWDDAEHLATSLQRFSWPWFYSNEAFSTFVTALRAKTTWEYQSQEAELIVMDRNANFREVVCLNIHAMLADHAIDGAGELLQGLTNYASLIGNDKSAYGYSDAKAFGVFGEAILGALGGVNGIHTAWKKGKHFAVRDIRRS